MNRFMITSIDKELLGVQQLVYVQNKYDFDRTRTAIHEIPIKNIDILLAGITVQPKDF
jgi:hypothetical protein